MFLLVQNSPAFVSKSQLDDWILNYSLKFSKRTWQYIYNISNDLLVHDRTYNSLPCGVGFVEERVEIRQKCVTYHQVIFRALQKSWARSKHSWILRLETERWNTFMGLMNEGGVKICLLYTGRENKKIKGWKRELSWQKGSSLGKIIKTLEVKKKRCSEEGRRSLYYVLCLFYINNLFIISGHELISND